MNPALPNTATNGYTPNPDANTQDQVERTESSIDFFASVNHEERNEENSASHQLTIRTNVPF